MKRPTIETVTRLVPLLVCLVLFQRGLFSWFVQDDFGSLLLAIRTRSFADALHWLTQPLAQGVMRPLPDAYFYIALYKMFGLNAFPYRLFVFATQFANLLLLTSITRRIAGSHWSALGGTLVWTANASLVVGMVWTSAYSQVLCCFFLLAGFLLFLKHVETGRWGLWWAQFAAFLLGLATLEITAVYPFILMSYCLLLARAQFWKTIPLTGVALLYGAFSVWMIPRAASGPYAMHFDGTILETLWHYWTAAIGVLIYSRNMSLGNASTLLLSLFLTGGLIWAIVRADAHRRRLASLGLAWFLLALAPVLPLRDQLMDYYLTVPTIGLGLTVAALLPSVPRSAAALWLGVYFVCSATFIPAGMRFWDQRSQTARRLILGAQEVRASNPSSVILLAGVTDPVYYAAIYDQGLSAGGVNNIFLMPEGKIATKAGFRSLERYELRPEAVADVLKQNGAEVLRVSADGSVQNVTSEYRVSSQVTDTAPAWVDLGLPSTSPVLGEGWHGTAGGIRWMGKRAELHLAAPTHPGSRLRIRAIAPPRADMAVVLKVSANGILLGEAEIRDPASSEQIFAIPDSLIGAAKMTVTLETNRTFRVPPDVRELGAAFGVIELI